MPKLAERFSAVEMSEMKAAAVAWVRGGDAANDAGQNQQPDRMSQPHDDIIYGDDQQRDQQHRPAPVSVA